MEDGHLASPGSLLHRGFGWLRLFILDLILIRFFRPGRRCRPSFRSHRICRHRSFLMRGRGEAGIGQGPVLAQPCPASGTEIRLQGNLLPAVMTELGDIRRLFMDGRFVDFFMDFWPTGRFGSFPSVRIPQPGAASHVRRYPVLSGGPAVVPGVSWHFSWQPSWPTGLQVFSRRDVITRCLGYLPFGHPRQREPFYGFRDLPDLMHAAEETRVGSQVMVPLPEPW